MNETMVREHSERQLLTGMSITELISYTKSLESEVKHLREQCIRNDAEAKGYYKSFKASQGWTTKYERALKEANRRLKEVCLEPVSVYFKQNDEIDVIAETMNDEQITMDMNTIERIEENGECPICTKFTHKMGRCPYCGTIY